MHDLTSLTAMGATTPMTTTIGGVTISENANLALASVAARHGQEAACQKALTQVLNAPAPEPGRMAPSTPIAAVWIAPDQWLAMAPYDSHELMAEDLKSRLGDQASVTEQSDAWVCFDIDGNPGVDLFERLCPAPVRRMQTGDAQRTTIHHMGCILLCFDAGRRIRILGPRSSAGSLHHALVTAALSVT